MNLEHHPKAVGYTLRYEPALDGLRAIAIVSVVLFHACASSSRPGWFRGGFVGVSVFFTLSGFLITSVLLREFDRDGSVDAGRFWARRIKRLIPAQMVMIGSVIVATWVGFFDTHRSDAIAAAWSVTNWHIIRAGPDRLLQTAIGPLGPTWSLAIEEQFYVVLMIVVIATVALSRHPARWLGWISLVTIVASVGAQLVGGTWNPRVEFGLDTRASELAVGVGLAVLLRQDRRWWWWSSRPSQWSSRWSSQWSSRWSRSNRESRSPASTTAAGHGRALDAVALTGLALVGVAAMTLTYDPPWLLRGGYTLVALVTAATIVGLIGGTIIPRAFATPTLGWMVWLGQLSYSWYLVHWPTFLVLTPDRTGLDGPALIVVKVATSLVVAIALSYGVERPLRQRAGVSSRIAVAWWVGSAAVLSVAAWFTLRA